MSGSTNMLPIRTHTRMTDRRPSRSAMHNDRKESEHAMRNVRDAAVCRHILHAWRKLCALKCYGTAGRLPRDRDRLAHFHDSGGRRHGACRMRHDDRRIRKADNRREKCRTEHECNYFMHIVAANTYNGLLYHGTPVSLTHGSSFFGTPSSSCNYARNGTRVYAKFLAQLPHAFPFFIFFDNLGFFLRRELALFFEFAYFKQPRFPRMLPILLTRTPFEVFNPIVCFNPVFMIHLWLIERVSNICQRNYSMRSNLLNLAIFAQLCEKIASCRYALFNKFISLPSPYLPVFCNRIQSLVTNYVSHINKRGTTAWQKSCLSNAKLFNGCSISQYPRRCYTRGCIDFHSNRRFPYAIIIPL